MPTALTAVQVEQLSSSQDRVGTPRALKVLRDEAEARLLALEVQSADWKSSVHLATTAALAGNTRTGNVLLANAAGALGNIDGVLAVAGRRYLIQFEGGVGAPHVNNGVYVLDDAGGATKFQFTRDTDFDESAEVTSDAVIPVELGTVYGGKYRKLTTTGAIAINITAIAFDEFSAEAAIHPPVANNGALIAIAANDRSDGMVVVQLDTMYQWEYDLGSAAAASDWCVVPTDGVGRWLRCDQTVGAILTPVANNAGLIALAAINRRDGSVVEQLDTCQVWQYDLGSAEAASDWCVVPTDAVGRWLLVGQTSAKRVHAAVANTGAISAITAANQIAGMVVADLATGWLWTYNATSAEAASATCLTAAGGVGRWIFAGARWGVPMQNRLRALGAPGILATGNTVVIGADNYEFRNDTPPTGGAAGNIWLYQGASSLDGRTTLVDAINGVVAAARIANHVATENFHGYLDPVTVGDVLIASATAPGGTPCPSAVATACTETLATATDIWDNATCRMGVLPIAPVMEASVVTLSAGDMAKLTIQFYFTFAPRIVLILNRNRAQNEAYAIVGNMVSLTLAGGASPNNQVADVVQCVAFS